MTKYFFMDEKLTESECKIIGIGLEKFKSDIANFLNSPNCDKKTRKNGLSKIDLINSAKNRIDNRINDFPIEDAITMYCGLDLVKSDSDSNCISAMKKLRAFFEATDVDIDAIINSPDDFV